ncbi:MAG: sensor histidine kinase [Actinobacteria bacterium]|nr:MAG: sensor histidine kinase [Actinomycetota bacterium]
MKASFLKALLPDGIGGARRSLRTRFVAVVIIGEIAFGLVLGLTVGLYAVRSAAEQRKESLRQISSAVAASLMPMIADQDGSHVEAQLQSILRMAEAGDIKCMRVLDGSGNVIAQSNKERDCCSTPADRSLMGLFTKPQVVEQPIEIGGVQAASIYVEFAPIGLSKALASPMLAAAIVVLSIALVSAPWTAWVIMRQVLEPISDLRDGASSIAEGQRDLVLHDGRQDEIGELGAALDNMSRQLAEKEERLRSSYAQLEEAFKLEAQAKTELEQLVKMKSDFVAMASHELRTPLSVIRLYAEMLEAGELCEPTEEVKEAFSSISSSANRLTSIVSDMIDAALLERGLMQLEFSRVDFSRIVRQAVTDARALSLSRGVDIELEDNGTGMSLWADSVRVRQVLDNLLSNAVKYSDGSALVSVEVHASDEFAVVEVIDRGCGIPRQRQSQLFNLFGRLDTRDNRDTAGLGLGLAISARIAEAHGGSISFRDNEEGKGSVFSLRMPLKLPEEISEGPAFVEIRGEAS